MLFPTVATATEGLQVAEVVAAAAGEGDDVIDRQHRSPAAASTLMLIPLKNVLPDFFRKADPLGLFCHG
jgi:hypothetical protein